MVPCSAADVNDADLRSHSEVLGQEDTMYSGFLFMREISEIALLIISFIKCFSLHKLVQIIAMSQLK